eukprot:3932457-Rhodomonas_salina.1
MARKAFHGEEWTEPTCVLPLTLQQEGFGELRFRYLDMKWRDDCRWLVKAINKLHLVHVDSSRGLKEGPKPAKADPNSPERVPDDSTSLSVAADWERPVLERAWAEGLKIDEKVAALQPPWPA